MKTQGSRRRMLRILMLACLLLPWPRVSAQAAAERREATLPTWRFAVSGDSRNCGDVVMPGIAAGVLKDHAEFYWHLGDLRAIYDFDQDYRQLASQGGKTLNIIDYENTAWDDFIAHQIVPFGTLPFFLGIGNHETIPPKTRAEFLAQFTDWLDTPELRDQRLQDDAKDHRLKTYYHWIRDGVDFINLDNASRDQFDDSQMKWFKALAAHDAGDASIRTIVAGMHEALPESISAGHSMNESAQGRESGEQVYRILLRLRNESHKNVYVLASHSHFFMEGIFNTEHWRTNGDVLPGWIIGTAGAVRYPLPASSSDAKAARTNVYGYLLATVNPPGQPRGAISFEFKLLERSQVPEDIEKMYTPGFVDECFSGNHQ